VAQDEQLLTISEVAERLGMTPRTISDWVGAKLIPSIRVAGEDDAVRVRAADLEAWIDGQRIRPRRRSWGPTVARPDEQLVTFGEAAKILGVSPATVWRRLAAVGQPFVEMRRARDGRLVRYVRTADVDRLAHERGAGTEPT
jgi:excisionase family DNA binding protein